MRLRQFAPPAFVVALIIPFFFFQFSSPRPLSLVIPTLYLLVNLTVVPLDSLQTRLEIRAVITTVFCHFTYLLWIGLSVRLDKVLESLE